MLLDGKRNTRIKMQQWIKWARKKFAREVKIQPKPWHFKIHPSPGPESILAGFVAEFCVA